MTYQITGDDNDTRRIVFDGRAYGGIEKLGIGADYGSFIVALHTTPPPMPRGGYFTAIPISPVKYRKENPTRCAFADEGSELIVYDDWGNWHRIEADRSVLDALVSNMLANDIPRKES